MLKNKEISSFLNFHLKHKMCGKKHRHKKRGHHDSMKRSRRRLNLAPHIKSYRVAGRHRGKKLS